jgi:hypothetical protein
LRERHQAGANVEELPDPGVGGQELNRPAQERAVGPDGGQDAGLGRFRKKWLRPVPGKRLQAVTWPDVVLCSAHGGRVWRR